jgi:hypothetical protein
VIEDTLYADDRVEEAEKLRDPTHVRSYTEDEWVEMISEAGFEVELREFFEKTHPFEDWLARTGCEGADAVRVKGLLGERVSADGMSWTDTKILLRARRSQR